MTICTHNRPLVRTHGGSLICFPCFFERRKRRSGPTHSEKAAARLKDYRQRKRNGKPGKRAEAAK